MTALVTTGDLISAADWNSLSQVISDETLSADASTHTISSIPGTFAHLRLVIEARTDEAIAASIVSLRFNNDSTSSYIYQTLIAAGTSVTTSQATGTSMNIGAVAGDNATAAHSGSIVVDIPDYSNSNWRQRAISQNSYRTGTAGPVLRHIAGEYTNTAVTITRIDLLTAANFVANSRFTLYGHRGL